MLVNNCSVQKGMAVPRPLKPVPYHHFHDHVAAMLSRPGIEEAILAHLKSGALEKELSDIMSAKAVREFLDASGQPFVRISGTELRLVWGIAADWYNPHQNKMAGKSVSTGVVAMVCLSLPQHLRYREDLLYLSTTIPGPKEPSLDAINPLITPLMYDLVVSYDPGIFITQTHSYPKGCHIFNAVIPLIADTLASKKMSGNCSHNGRFFAPAVVFLETISTSWILQIGRRNSRANNMKLTPGSG